MRASGWDASEYLSAASRGSVSLLALLLLRRFLANHWSPLRATSPCPVAAEIESKDPPGNARGTGAAHPFHGLRCLRARQYRVPAPGRRPGADEFRSGWDDIGTALEEAVSSQDYASLARCTQYAHFTPEFIVRAIWSGLQRLGWRGGKALEPGVGIGLFPALMLEDRRRCLAAGCVPLDPDVRLSSFPKRHFAVTTYIVTVHLLIDVGKANPRTGVAAQLDKLFSDIGGVALVDWVVAGIDLADSMAAMSLPPGYRPGESCFPSWPGRPRGKSAAIAAAAS